MILKENGEVREERPYSNNKEVKQKREAELDYDSARNSVSSQAEGEANDDARSKRVSRVSSKMTGKKETAEASIRSARGLTDRKDNNKLHFKQSNNSNNRKRPETPQKVNFAVPKSRPEQRTDILKVANTISELPEATTDKIIGDKVFEELKELDISDEAPNCDQSVGTDNETVDTEENNLDEDKLNAYQKIEEMETRIEKLEDELREVAALEISLYSVVPEHGSSVHKIHTPARRLSRLFIYACKHWSQEKRATVAKNTASGLVFIAKSCGNDVARLTFWLSNIVFLREIISIALGSSFSGSVAHENGVHQPAGRSSPRQCYPSIPCNKTLAGFGSFKGFEDWQDSNTFRIALERIESWIFARVVESVWWQTFTPQMQSPVDHTCKSKNFGKLLGPSLGDQRQGAFSINLWENAFLDAFNKLCPVRAGGNECGCLPVLARMVMKQCINRLDVAMFNAILRESANQIPTDPISDPIIDAKILPIPAGNLSFGSGAQLKNAIGYWSRCLSDLFGIDAGDSITDEQADSDTDIQHGSHIESKCFLLLNSLSDLLMLPKDLLVNVSVRKEVCPSIGLPLIVRILCNFTPDEFCPDPVPCAVLEDLNTESLLERQVSGNKSTASFPYSTGPLLYFPPSAADVVQKVGDPSSSTELVRDAPVVQSRGYASDEDLDDMDSPLSSISDLTPPVSPASGNGSLKGTMYASMRFELLREVWSA